MRVQAAAAAQPTRVSKQERWKKLDELLSRASLYSDFLTEQLVGDQRGADGAQNQPQARPTRSPSSRPQTATFCRVHVGRSKYPFLDAKAITGVLMIPVHPAQERMQSSTD